MQNCPGPREWQDNDDPPKYKCCCETMHVESGAFAFAVLGTVCSALAIAANLLYASAEKQNFIPILVWLFVYLLIFVAQAKRVPALYLPFLFLIALGTLVAFTGTMLLAYLRFPEFTNFKTTFSRAETNRLYLVVGASALAIGSLFAFNVWQFWVVLRAYEYMREEQQRQRAWNAPIAYQRTAAEVRML